MAQFPAAAAAARDSSRYVPRPALVPIEPPIQWVMGSLPGEKWLWSEAELSPPPRAEVKNGWCYTFMLLCCAQG